MLEGLSVAVTEILGVATFAQLFTNSPNLSKNSSPISTHKNDDAESLKDLSSLKLLLISLDSKRSSRIKSIDSNNITRSPFLNKDILLNLAFHIPKVEYK